MSTEKRENTRWRCLCRSNCVCILVYSYDKFTLQLEEARLALLEATIDRLEVKAAGPTAARVSWRLAGGTEAAEGEPAMPKFVDSFRVHFRRRRTDRYERFQAIELPAASVGSMTAAAAAATAAATVAAVTITDLDPHTEYEVFVQPYFVQVAGKPSNMRLVKTHQVRRGLFLYEHTDDRDDVLISFRLRRQRHQSSSPPGC